MCVDMCSIAHCNTEKKQRSFFYLMLYVFYLSPLSIRCLYHTQQQKQQQYTELKFLIKRTDGRTAREKLCSTACCLLCAMLKRMKESCPLQNCYSYLILFFPLSTSYPMHDRWSGLRRIRAYKHQAHKHGPSNFCVLHSTQVVYYRCFE